MIKKFEYLYGPLHVLILNDYGRDGWEMVCVFPSGHETLVMFKREISDEAPEIKWRTIACECDQSTQCPQGKIGSGPKCAIKVRVS